MSNGDGGTVELDATDATWKITLGDWGWVDGYYSQCFVNVQQGPCKIIGKAWVKLLEPKKQSKYPYRREDPCAPPWWPLGTVRHKEPDHLYKRGTVITVLQRRKLTVIERIALLIHIIHMVVRQDACKTEHLKTITVKRLQKAAESATSTWFRSKEKPSKAEKQIFLQEIIRVADMEECHWKGQFGSHTQQLPDTSAAIPVENLCELPDSVLSDNDGDTLIPITTPHSAANVSLHTPPVATPFSVPDQFFHCSCQHYHCTTTAQGDYPAMPLHYPPLTSYDYTTSQQRLGDPLPECQDHSMERQYNLLSFTRQQRKAMTAYSTPSHPSSDPSSEQQQQTEYDEMLIDSFGDTGVSFGQ
jgi:hypothetical protein